MSWIFNRCTSHSHKINPSRRKFIHHSMTMTILSTLLSIGSVSLLVASGVNGQHSIRAVLARRTQDASLPYAFIVSHAGKANGKDWCMTTKNGVADGDDVGFELCDFANAPDAQLFQLDNSGKIHTKVDSNQCFVIDDGTKALSKGHSRLKFLECDAQVLHMTFTHDRSDNDKIAVKDSPSFCLKQKGNGPDTTDSFRTFLCDDPHDAGITFDYKEQSCSTNLSGVDCCENSDCGTTERCQDYSCVGASCSTSTPGIECCTDSDCAPGATCTDDNTCEISTGSPIGTCDILDAECCFEDDDCPVDYDCNTNTCVKPAVFLVSTISGQDFCMTAYDGVGDYVKVGSELCDFVNNPASQLWHRDPLNKIHSNLDIGYCVIVGPGQKRGGLNVNLAPCKANVFLYDDSTDQLKLGQDTTYCLESNQNNIGGRMSGRECKDLDDYKFEFRAI